MPKPKIDLPNHFEFSTLIPIRITDLNYSGHVGNDSVLSLIHEARQQYFGFYGWTELDFGGAGTIMRDVTIEFMTELFYGDTIKAFVTMSNLSRVYFDVYYKFETEREGKSVVAALSRTGMVCFDYGRKKVVSLPESVRKALGHRSTQSS